jgi:D-aminopeptidase
VWAALDAVAPGPVEEGCVGSGTGMQCFDYKGGIGTASRSLEPEAGGYTVGVLAMTNHGDREDLLIDGVRVGERLPDDMPIEHTEGSCIVVVATDAPLLPHQLRRVAERAGMGLSRGGSHASNTSGEQLIAFSTANRVPLDGKRYTPAAIADGPEAGRVLSAVFRATVEATEEAVVNALLAARTMTGRDGNTLFALPADRTLELVGAAGRLSR